MSERPRMTDPTSDPIDTARFDPHDGPRLLFFSGGTALGGPARALTRYTSNSIHLITTFDSGGSSQVLREAFDMPAVGDLRNRLMALTDTAQPGHAALCDLFDHRLPETGPPVALMETLARLQAGTHPLIAALPDPLRSALVTRLAAFWRRKPAAFDLQGACIGNLILTGSYFLQGRRLDRAVADIAALTAVRGTVRPTVDGILHLCAEQADGSIILGQNRITATSHPIACLFLSEDATSPVPSPADLPDATRALIASADLICFPPGSFYSSVLANLLPRGVGQAIADSPAPKVYVPSLGADSECPDLTLSDRIAILLRALRSDAGADCPADRLLTCVLTDHSVTTLSHSQDIPIRTSDLISPASSPWYDPDRLCRALIGLR